MKKLFLSKKTNSIIQENILNESSMVEKAKQPPVQEDLFAVNKSMLDDVKIKLPLIDFLKKPEKISNKKQFFKWNKILKTNLEIFLVQNML